MKLPVLPPWANIALKAAPYVAILALIGLLILANGKLDSRDATIEAKDQRIEALISQRNFFSAAVSQRDTMIAKQNASIDALAAAAVADRQVYLKGLEAARAVSADHLKASRELLALTAPEGELAQCRAARDLLESELVSQ